MIKSLIYNSEDAHVKVGDQKKKPQIRNLYPFEIKYIFHLQNTAQSINGRKEDVHQVWFDMGNQKPMASIATSVETKPQEGD